MMTVGEDRPKVSSLESLPYSSDCKRMLAQQRLPVHLEYLQPHITSSESKASPLALLAATCSSIGKGDDKKEMKATPSILSKLSTRDESSKSSFKPYRFDVKPSIIRNSPPSLNTSTSLFTPTVKPVTSDMLEKRITTSMSLIESERSRCFSEAAMKSTDYKMPLKCRTTSPLSQLPPKAPMLSPHHDHSECSQCKSIRPHSDPLSLRLPQPQGPSCPCPSCNQTRADLKCHYPTSNLSSLYPPYKSAYMQPFMPCRDPACTNCTKSHTTVQNFLHPALIHQCTHNVSHKPLHPPPTNGSTYEPYIKPANTKPYVCNWVSEGKHCGNSFPTSEELFQHLRTHTNLQQQHTCESQPTAVPSQIPQNNVCNVHGCLCGQRKSSPRPLLPGYSYGHGASTVRYTPYSRGSHSYPPGAQHSTFSY